MNWQLRRELLTNVAAVMGGGIPAPTFSLDFTTLTPSTLTTAGVTFSRASNATQYDSTGKLTYGPSNIVLYSADVSGISGIWSTSNSGAAAPTMTANQAVAPDGTTTAAKAVYPAVSAGGAFSMFVQTIASDPNNYVDSIYLKGDVGGEQIYLFSGGPGTNYTTLCTLTTSWQRFSASGLHTNAVWYFCVGVDLRDGAQSSKSAQTIYAWGGQRDKVTYETTARAYVATLGSAVYGPRFDYNPSSLAAKGLLIEEARTNSALYSDAFDNAAWTKTNVTVSANSQTSPDGTANADTLTASAGNGTVTQAVTTTAISWTYSVWLLRKTGSGNIQITMDGTNYVTQTINGSTWTLCTVTQTGVAGTSTPGIKIVTNGDAVYAFGAQAEAGDFATSYIPTTSASATRARDDAYITSPSFYNDAAGTWNVVFDSAGFVTGSNRTIIYPVRAGGNNETYMYGNSTGVFGISIVGGAFQYAINGGVPAASTQIKAAFAYAANNNAISKDGAAVVTDTTHSNATLIAEVHIGSDGGGGDLNGHMKSLAYYTSRLSDSQLVTLTS